MPNITILDENQINKLSEPKEISGIGIKKEHNISGADLLNLIYQANDMPLDLQARQEFNQAKEEKAPAEPIETTEDLIIEEPEEDIPIIEPLESTTNEDVITKLLKEHSKVCYAEPEPEVEEKPEPEPEIFPEPGELSEEDTDKNELNQFFDDNDLAFTDDDFSDDDLFEDEIKDAYESAEPLEDVELSNIPEQAETPLKEEIEPSTSNIEDMVEDFIPDTVIKEDKTKSKEENDSNVKRIKIVRQKSSPKPIKDKVEHISEERTSEPVKKVKKPKKKFKIPKAITKTLTVCGIFILAILFYEFTTLVLPNINEKLISKSTNKATSETDMHTNINTDDSLQLNTDIKISVLEVEGADGYEVHYSEDNTFPQNSTKVVEVEAANKAIESLSKGKTYYVKVRAYKFDENGEKIYGDYTDTQTIHT